MKRIPVLLLGAAFVFLFVDAAICLINVNTASESELDSLPGIGPVLAGRIIEGRPYRSVDDLTRVKGIGEKTLAKFRNMVTVGAASTPGKENSSRETDNKPAVPVYSVEKFKLLKCGGCSNQYHVSDALKSGFCPYCGTKWRLKGEEPKAPEPAVESKKAPEPTTESKKASEPAAESKKAPDVIPFQDANNYIGQSKTVSGTIVGTHLSARSGNLYLNFHSDYRTYLSVKIPSADIGRFPADAANYYNRRKVVATGQIMKEGNYLRLVVTDPADLQVVE